jgi:hypothetical protein
MGLRPLVGLAVGFAVAILIAGKVNFLRNPILSAQLVFWGCLAPLDCRQFCELRVGEMVKETVQ